ncbi:MAG: hypothetical protein ACEY3J_02730 [Arsenophonus sp.]
MKNKKTTNYSIVFTNFIDFYSSYGYSDNVTDYVVILELFDRCLPEMPALIENKNILIITADHCCDTT